MTSNERPAAAGSIRARDGMLAVIVLDFGHCQQCGTEDDIYADGYSRCCNERIVDAGDCDDDQCWH